MMKTLQIYQEGLHVLLTLQVDNPDLLINYPQYLDYAKKLLEECDTEVVGETFHIFDNNSFTSAIILKESHLCIHTWPEFQQLTLDLLLCNYYGNNTEKVEKITSKLLTYFEAQIIKEHKIRR